MRVSHIFFTALFFTSACNMRVRDSTSSGATTSENLGSFVGRKVSLGKFIGVAELVDKTTSDSMIQSGSLKANCPIPVNKLAQISVTHWGFDGAVHTGKIVVHQKLANDMLDIFAEIFIAKYPIEKINLVDKYGASDEKSMLDNNTSAFNCREKTGSPGNFSLHSYGVAIDLNPLQNPYATANNNKLIAMGWNGSGAKLSFLQAKNFASMNDFCRKNNDSCLIEPATSAKFLDRNLPEKGYILANSVVVNAFKKRGFSWGGEWGNVLDYQHFEYPKEKLPQ